MDDQTDRIAGLFRAAMRHLSLSGLNTPNARKSDAEFVARFSEGLYAITNIGADQRVSQAASLYAAECLVKDLIDEAASGNIVGKTKMTSEGLRLALADILRHINGARDQPGAKEQP